MTIRLLWRVLGLAVLASLVLVGLAAAAGQALAQGKPDQPQQTASTAPHAPNAYSLQGDATNSGAAVTYFDSSSSISGGAWQFATDAQDGTALAAYCLNSSSWNCWAVSAAAYGIGVRGETLNPAGGYGVYGKASGVNGTGVYGTAEGDSASTYGVDGYSNNGSGVHGSGLIGVRGAASGAGGSAGYGGYFSASAGIGLYASSSSNYAIYGNSASSYGVFGVSSSYIALRGASSSSYGAYINTLSGNIALRVINPNKAAGKYAAYFDGNVRINGSYVATGTKSALVYTSQGERLMYAEEATQNYFSDQGTAQLREGRTVIKIDPLFAQTVSLNGGYQVFTSAGSADTLGLAVINKTASSFEVVEQSKGKGNYSFDWRISALRKGYEKERMAPAPADVAAAQESDLPQAPDGK